MAFYRWRCRFPLYWPCKVQIWPRFWPPVHVAMWPRGQNGHRSIFSIWVSNQHNLRLLSSILWSILQYSLRVMWPQGQNGHWSIFSIWVSNPHNLRLLSPILMSILQSDLRVMWPQGQNGHWSFFQYGYQIHTIWGSWVQFWGPFYNLTSEVMWPRGQNGQKSIFAIWVSNPHNLRLLTPILRSILQSEVIWPLRTGFKVIWPRGWKWEPTSNLPLSHCKPIPES